ncbi:hypothetical protein OIE66_15455 [Nonomuraea sp. NBC_01738]|uniref:hypothetical protein n=1 Tax=Nonomuraea sp. NBC_01738 TaxID=2976003 RepID=UPI002E0DA6E9|nr:hypothetical protein OIE66_15455 [Nonomuraea sp. NBC_01738]
MRETEVISQIWTFYCATCDHVWQDEYEARHLGQGVCWRHRGVTSMPPWAHATCVSCEGVTVKVLPAVPSQ